ncbi:unnamed protein product [Closterium sp. NIES-53]
MALERSRPYPTALVDTYHYSSGGFSSSACGSLHRGALSDPASTHTGASEVLSVGAVATSSLVPALVNGSGATSPTAQLSFTLDPGASSCFFRDCTDLTPLHTPVTVALADPSVESVVAHSTTILPCPATPSGFLTGYYTPSFSRNLVGVSHLYNLGFVTTFPLDEPVASCTVAATGAPLATFHREPGSGLYSLHTGSGQVSRMVRHRLVSGLLESFTPPPHLPAPPCTPCVEGRHRAAPHSSLPPTTAPLQTLHLDVWGPSLVLGPRQECYFLIVVDEYSHKTPGFPLQQKADVPTVLEPWLLARGGAHGLCGLCLHSDSGAPPSLCPAPSGVSHITPQSSPPHRPVPVVCGGAGGAAAEGGGTGAAGLGGAISWGAGGVRVETFPVEDTVVSIQRPSLASPPGFPSVPNFPPHSSLRPVAVEPGGVPAGGTGDIRGVVAGGSCYGGAGAGDTGTAMPTSRTLCFLTHVQR